MSVAVRDGHKEGIRLLGLGRDNPGVMDSGFGNYAITCRRHHVRYVCWERDLPRG